MINKAFLRSALVAMGYPKLAQTPTGMVQGMADQNGGLVLEARPQHRKDNFRVRRPDVLDNMDACVTGTTTKGWQKGAGTPVLTPDFTDPRPNAPCFCSMKITGATNFVTISKDFGDLPGGGIKPSNGVLMIPFKVEEMPLLDNAIPAKEQLVGVTVILSTTPSGWDPATAPTMATCLALNSNATIRQGWTDLLISHLDDGTLNNIGDGGGNAPQPGWKYEGSAPGNADTVYRYMRITISGLAPTAFTPKPTVKLGGIFQNGRAQANIVVHCDDGQKDTIDLLRVYNARNIPVTVGVITGSVGVAQFMGLDQLRELYNQGNDIVSHTVTHPNGGIAGMSAEQLKSELETSLAWLRNNQFPRISDMIVYPQNAFRDRDLAAVKAAGFKMGRGSRPGYVSTVFGIDNALALGSRAIESVNLATAKRMVDAAYVFGCTQILFMHQIAYTQLKSVTFAGGTGTVVYESQSGVTMLPAGGVVPAGTLIYLRGADDAAYNIAAHVEPGATATGFTFKYAAGIVPDGSVVRNTLSVPNRNGNLRFYSPAWPAAGTMPPPGGVYWYMADHIALANYIADEWAAGRVTPISMATLAERCQLG